MADVIMRDIRKTFGVHEVLRGCSLEIHEGEKIGLVGANGSGKTTLFRILCGLEAADAGSLQVASARRIGMLEQIPDLEEGLTVRDVMMSAFSDLLQRKAELDALTTRMETDAGESLIRRFGALQHAFEADGGFEIDHRCERVATGLSIEPAMQLRTFATLSGGEKTRVNLARIILMNTDMLLLDEPTNHLDIASVEWLEEFIRGYAGTVVVISHDRWFLDRTVRRILEIEDGVSTSWPGNYSAFAALKEQKRIEQMQRYEQEQKKIRQLQEAVKRMHDWAQRADNPKMHRRAFSMEKRLDRMAESGTDKPRTERRLKSGFREERFMGAEALKAEHASKSFDGRTVLADIDFTLYRGQRAALIGANGSGKTTLLRLLLGELEPETGCVRIGESARCGFLPQEVRFEAASRSMIDTLRFLKPMDEGHARNLLAGFGFTGETVFKAVGTLSGGEKSRLKLCLLMQDDVNLLVLDEPTNHLDIRSREWVEEALEAWSGTMLFVSHDRYFIRRFADRMLLLEEGRVSSFDGDYDEFREWREECGAAVQETAAAVTPAQNDTERVRRLAKERQRRIGSLEKRVLEGEERIRSAEDRICCIAAEMAAHPDDAEHISRLYAEREALTASLDAFYESWMTDQQTLAEAIEAT